MVDMITVLRSAVKHFLKKGTEIEKELSRGIALGNQFINSWKSLISRFSRKCKKTTSFDVVSLTGPSDRSRTCGLLNPIQARYQTALHPVGLIIIAQVFTKCKPFFEKTFNFFREFKNGGTGPVQALVNIVKITEKTGVYFTEVTKIS